MARQLAPEVPTADGERPTETQRNDASEVCPLCTFAADTESSVYVHLQTCHRKSQIARAVLDEIPADSTDTAVESQQLNDGRLRPIGDSSE